MFSKGHLEHPENAEFPILVTEFRIVTAVSPEQPLNAEAPMVCTEFGIVTDVSPVHPSNAIFPIVCTPVPKSSAVSLEQ